MATTAYGRDTRFELLSVRQDANGYRVHITERATRAESFDLPDLLTNEMFSDEEHALLIQAFTIIEKRAAEKYDALLISPEEAQLRMLAAAKAKKEAEDAAVAAAKAKADQAASEHAASEADERTIATKQQILSMKQALKDLDKQIQAKREEIAQLSDGTIT